MKRVVLIGAGHAHLVVLRSLAEKPLYNARIALVSPYAKQVYSGMLPGILAGHYRRAEAEVDIAALAERGQVEFVQGRVQHLDADRRTVTLESGQDSSYDFASINAGARVDASLPGAERALPVKPYEELLARLRSAGRVAVVGAGAAGAEIAMALRHRVFFGETSGGATRRDTDRFDSQCDHLLVIDHAVGRIDFSPLAGKTVFLLEGLTRGWTVFSTEMTHMRVTDSGYEFYKGSLFDNIRLGTLLYDFPAVAARLGLRKSTVESHVTRMREKLGAAHRAHLIALAHEYGLL